MTEIGGFVINMLAVWLILMVVFLIVEGLFPGLVSIWFALGSLAALVAALVGAPLWLQILWFFIVSIAALALTRPLAKKYINSKVQPTNADKMIGRECVVTERIDNINGSGAVSCDGNVWTARMADESLKAAENEIVRVLKIEGVKLIVEPVIK